MDNQNSLDTTTKKASKKPKIIAGIIIVCIAALVAVLVIINRPVSPAEKTVNAFMKAFKEEDYYAMDQQCYIYAFDDEELGIYSYSGTNIIDYKIKSVSDPYKVKKRYIVKKYGSSEDFEEHKQFEKKYAEIDSKRYGIEFVEVENSNNCYILESLQEVLDEYTVTLDVQYSTILGNTKRNSVTITVCQSDIESDKYKITDIWGIIH